MKKSILRKLLTGVISIVLIGGILSGCGDAKSSANAANNNKSVEQSDKEVAKDKTEEDSKVNYNNFLKVSMGMKQVDVFKILGEGVEESSSEISGIKTAIYAWNGSGLSNMNVTIQNGIVTGKAQAGLEKPNAKITLAKYNEVNEGMNYVQVKGILGEGEITSQVALMGTETIMYSWINSSGANMSATFTNGKMDMKAQFGLE